MKKSTKKCYICAGKNSVFNFKKINKIQLVKCIRCKIIHIKRGALSETDVDKYYTKTYYNKSSSISGYANYDSSEITHRKNFNRLIKAQTKGIVKNKNLLDYGCGYGYLLSEAKKFNYKTFGVEKSNFARSKAVKNKQKVFKNINFLIKKKIKFDIIFIIGTIEHLIDPKKTIKNFHKILKLNGKLVITTIDTNGFFPLFKLKPPEHTFYFNNKNLKLLLNKCNFEVENKNTYFANYILHDLIYRLAMFFNSKILKKINIVLKKYFPHTNLLIPTNEMKIIAKKMG